MKVIAFAASSSSTSINKQLVTHAVSYLADANVEILDLNDFELPLFSEDKEKAIGQPDNAKAFLAKIEQADAVVVSFAEHNGSYSAAYKNLFDWCSRINPKVYQDKAMILLATSPGPGGAKNVLAAAAGSMPFFGAEVKGSLSIPSFYDNFDLAQQSLVDDSLNGQLQQVMSAL
ncbi:NADPH-dependent FMN reductase [Photobacterium aphoticum]|uniref:NADPH-dependent FMN reductase n=1 Tax=Photobacterium aphoticum TaxID=754436 RepID=A0A0J1GQ79_9GAMM|nr:NADPH-dependent FMN reductase [Photobacterium aphoticum]KLV01796.1 NADPH-dependent FMN reductase [Photobacterium aphoticum]PSU58718.1 NAD(P)H-dependent oxidoreductase [Photobacterium aphoticum]GHA32537.1 FMN reductase [Photobacterium aphoticum]